jgi:GT2 family glycosyltransferase
MEIILVDSGSQDTTYIDQLTEEKKLTVFKTDNIGFSRANNIGYQQIKTKTNYVLFLNPDAFLSDAMALAGAIDFMEQQESTTIGCITGRLIGFEHDAGKSTGYIDSTGIFRKWFGRWYDRGHAQKDVGQYMDAQDVPAACGAFMFCRKSTLDQIALQRGIIFDPDFFLYKEDIELSLRIQKSLWRIVYLPNIIIYHCRGWQTRTQIPHRLRLTAAENEILLYRKHPSPYIFWAFFKYFLVRYLRA